MEYTTGWKSNGKEKSIYTMEDFWEAISQTFCTEWVCIYFPMLWEIDEETQASPI